jgi:hypothetical protein
VPANPAPAIDVSAITTLPSREETRAFRAVAAGSQGYPKPGSRVRGTIARVLFGLVLVGIAATFIAMGLEAEADPEPADESGGAVFFVLASVPLLFAVLVIAKIQFRDPFVRFLQLDRFARGHHLRYLPITGKPPYPGTLFHKRSAGPTFDRLVGSERRPLEIGNYRYTLFSKAMRSITWGYLVLRMDRKLPQMILHSRRNERQRRLISTEVIKRQTLSLEGDFDKHFTLYVPQGYERDALYVFTPDLMGLVIDKTGDLDIEIVDDWIIFYSPKKFDLLDPATLTRLFGIADVLGAKFHRQSDRYADDRDGAAFGANTVGRRGRRLTVVFPYVAGGFAVLGTFILGQVLRSFF